MKYGLLGKTLKHSFSPLLHSELGNKDYQLIELNEDQLDSFFYEKNFEGINVTIPYKQTVIKYLDEIDESASSIGAVNTIVNKNGKLIGYNTDYLGLKYLIAANGIDLKDKVVMLLGTGGAAKNALYLCHIQGVKQLINVSILHEEGTIPYEEVENYYDSVDVIINCTPCGMYPDVFNFVIDVTKFTKLEALIDVIYNPLNPILVSTTKVKKGVKATGGLMMLIAQGLYSEQYFFDQELDKSLIDKIYLKMEKEKENIVLIGMPNSGKSTVGLEVANKLHREFIDLDKEIEKEIKMDISSYFAKYGEAEFRKVEKEMIKKYAPNSSLVIATGGGVILDEDNIVNLSLNGKLFFLNQKLDKLYPTNDRPLSNSKEKLEEMYEYRLPLYMKYADEVVNMTTINKEVNQIVEEYL